METKITTKPRVAFEGTRLFAHQLITSEDLIAFKQELLTELRNSLNLIQQPHKKDGSRRTRFEDC